MNIDPQTGLDLDDASTRQQIAMANGGAGGSGMPQIGAPAALVSHVPPPDAPPPAPLTTVSATAAGLADAPAVVQPPAVAPPKETTSKDVSTTSVRRLVTPEERKQQAALVETEKAQEGVLQQQGGLAGQAADIQAQAAQNKAELSAQHGAALKAVVDHGNAELQQRQKAYDQAQQAYAKATPQEFFKDENGKDKFGKRLWAGIAMALGAAGAVLGHTQNFAQQEIDASIAAFDAKERERIDRLAKVAAARREDIGTARQAKADALADLSAQKAAAYDHAADEIGSRLAQLGKPQAEIATNAAVLENRKKAQEEKAQWFNQTRAEVHSTVTQKTQEIIGGAAAGAAGNGKGEVARMKYAQLGSALKESLEGSQDLPLPSSDDLRKVQYNRGTVENASATHGLTGALLMRAQVAGALPSSSFEGIKDEGVKTRLQRRDLAAIKIAEILGSDEKARKEIHQNLSWQPGDSPKTMLDKDRQMRTLGQQALNLARDQGGIAETGQPGPSRIAQPAAVPSRAQLLPQAAALKKLIQAHPEDPRIGEAKAKYQELVQQMGGAGG